MRSADVVRRPFVTDEVIETDYDPTRMQDHLFVIPSFAWLRKEAEGLVERLLGTVNSPSSADTAARILE